MTEINADERALLRDSQRRVDGHPPNFEQVFAKAQAMADKPRWPKIVATASVAAAAGWFALSILMQPPSAGFRSRRRPDGLNALGRSERYAAATA